MQYVVEPRIGFTGAAVPRPGPLGAGLAGIMFFWVCGKKYVETQVNTGRDKKFTDKFYPICKYIFCPVCFLVLILGIVLGGIG